MAYVKIFLLSILLFFSISFITVIDDLNIPPLGFVDNPCTIKIGFPFTYYHHFLVESPIPNSGWTGGFIPDYIFALVISIGFYYLKRFLNKRKLEV